MNNYMNILICDTKTYLPLMTSCSYNHSYHKKYSFFIVLDFKSNIIEIG